MDSMYRAICRYYTSVHLKRLLPDPNTVLPQSSEMYRVDAVQTVWD
jgi:hypothetical protein